MAGVEGLEPSQAVLETDVLPLTLYPYGINNYYLSIFYNNIQDVLKKFLMFAMTYLLFYGLVGMTIIAFALIIAIVVILSK